MNEYLQNLRPFAANASWGLIETKFQIWIFYLATKNSFLVSLSDQYLLFFWDMMPM